MPIFSFSQKSKITLHQENNQIIDASLEPPIQYLNGDVKIFHAGTFMYCDRAILRDQVLKMYDNVVMIQNDTIKIFADSLHYNGDSLIARIYGNIIFENGFNRKLYTTYLHYDVAQKLATYTKNGKLIDKTSELKSKRGRYYLNEQLAYFYENVKVTDENFLLITDSLKYDLATNTSYFLSKVRIEKDTNLIYSEGGWFDLEKKIGDFIGNAQYQEGNNRAKGDTISYDGTRDIVIIKSSGKRSEYYSEKDTALANVIYFDQTNETFQLTGDGYYKGEKNEVKGDDIYYDKKTEKFKVKGRSQVSDAPYIIDADTLDYDKALKIGKADGNVIWRDTSAKTAIIADHVFYDGEKNSMLATNDVDRPMFISEIDGDSLFMKADTLKSIRLFKERVIYPDFDAVRRAQQAQSKKDTLPSDRDIFPTETQLIESDSTQIISIREDTLILTIMDSVRMGLITDTIYTGIIDTLDFFIGQKNVRLFKKDFQAICDSLVYSNRDSIFTFFEQPYVWSDSSQIAGDTIQIMMKDKKMDRLAVRNNATILSTNDYVFFNQIQGRFMQAFFEDNKMKRLDVDGNAQVLYYLTDDDKAYIGINKTEASKISFEFDESQVISIRNYVEPKSKVLPMKSTNHEQIKIKGFLWNIEKRPQSQEDL